MPPLTYIHAFEAARTTAGNFELKKRNMTLADHYIAVIKRYRKELLKLSHLIVADAFFSTRTFYASAEWQLISIQFQSSVPTEFLKHFNLVLLVSNFLSST